jgi:SAM-dependent methyltransferase
MTAIDKDGMPEQGSQIDAEAGVQMEPLSEEEKVHLRAFEEARPDWRLYSVGNRWSGENNHKSGKLEFRPSHPYLSGMHYVMSRLAPMAPLKILDIGSPFAQDVALACVPGIEVTVLDIRDHPEAERFGLKWVKGNATELPFDDESWDVVTSLWVMGHVGDGRYGDPFDVDGDKRMLREIARVLKPGGTAIIGPGLLDFFCVNVFNMHRIYSWEWLEKEFSEVGLKLQDTKDLLVTQEMFIDPTWHGEEGFVIHRRDGYYGVATLTKQPG